MNSYKEIYKRSTIITTSMLTVPGEAHVKDMMKTGIYGLVSKPHKNFKLYLIYFMYYFISKNKSVKISWQSKSSIKFL